MAADWEKRYREQVANLEEQLVFNPNDELLKATLAAVKEGDFDKVLSKLATEAYQVVQAAQLTFNVWCST